MQRRSFLQAIAAGVTAFAMPTRTTVAEDGGLVYVFELGDKGGVYGFRINVPADQWCLTIFTPAPRTMAVVRYIHTRIQPNCVLLSHEEWLLKKLDASHFANDICPVAFPALTEGSPLWLKARSVTDRNEELLMVACCDVGDVVPSCPALTPK